MVKINIWRKRGDKENIMKIPRKIQIIRDLKKEKNIKEKDKKKVKENNKKRRLPILLRRGVMGGIILITIKMNILMKSVGNFIPNHIPTIRGKKEYGKE